MELGLKCLILQRTGTLGLRRIMDGMETERKGNLGAVILSSGWKSVVSVAQVVDFYDAGNFIVDYLPTIRIMKCQSLRITTL